MPIMVGADPAAGGSARPRILVVDDIQINRAIARVMLEYAGFQVLEADSGIGAIAIQSTQPCDIILMDLQMPEMDGFTAAGRIRAGEAALDAARARILALSALEAPGVREACLAAGMDDYMVKPYQRGQLLQYVARWVNPAGQDRGDPAKSTVPELDDRILQALGAVLPMSVFIELVEDHVRIGLDQAAALGVASAKGATGRVHQLVCDLGAMAEQIGLRRLAQQAAEVRYMLEEGQVPAAVTRATLLAEFAREGWHLLCMRFLDRPEVRAAS